MSGNVKREPVLAARALIATVRECELDLRHRVLTAICNYQDAVTYQWARIAFGAAMLGVIVGMVLGAWLS